METKRISLDAGDLAMTRRDAIKRTALLLGLALSPSLLAGLEKFQSDESPAAKPLYLDKKQLRLAGAIAERIIPRTDTPGAIDVGVPSFIDLMYGEFMSDAEKSTLIQGLAELDAASLAAHGKEFGALAPEPQDKFLRAIAEGTDEAQKIFFRQMKELTLLGYFTSEPVGKTVLHYNPVPGRFEPCLPISEVGNVSWTT